MSPLLISLGAGVAAGLIYALLKVRSPAPPAVALIGLLGMVIGSSLGGTLFNYDSAASLPASNATADQRPAAPHLLPKQAG